MLIALFMAAVAAPTPPADVTRASLCGLEEVSVKELKTCPSYVTYDEEGQEVGEKARDRQDR